MIVHLRNPAAYWRLVLTVLLLFILLTGYFVRNPTSMTKNKIRLRDSCLDPMMIPGEEEHRQKLSLEFFVLHREKLLNLGKQECKIVSPIIDQIFDLELSSSRSLVVNDKSFKAKVNDEWFDHDQALILKFQSLQRVTSTYNKWNKRTTIRNPFRAQRPRPKNLSKNGGGNTDAKEELFKIIRQNQGSECDFCSKRVAEDPLGHFENERVYVAANAFKMQSYHALFIPKQHNPLMMTLEDYKALFEIANIWFDKISYPYAAMTWDVLPHAGASQIHTHLQGFVGHDHQIGQFRAYQEARQSYGLAYPGADLTQDYVNVHIALGLGLKIGRNAVLSPLDATKDHEIVILGPKVDDLFAEIVHAVHLTFVHELNVLCWSSAMSWPTGPAGNRDNDFAQMRIGSRGNCLSSVSDVSSLELYMFNSVDTNPYDTIEAFRKKVQKL